ncbi:Wzz/FepE/Etk N-terminal domain-containing protein [Undibacterium sp.]|jgi:succinoglycan biosynthesis transport protein ExoP|uniref:Wzz/FepE/Etk N-terminal domain-containing protein n=2 Tax=Undibacterium TaxID=401469 RepID=UPI002731126D|nr:Wzz/FepE/Etk N-terminal domain-containing protein [Undibacterium sp.]MDP1977096.1 Wzz/FepE/Etk N-terminal domain-containing protein [Undibacterium sp.]
MIKTSTSELVLSFAQIGAMLRARQVLIAVVMIVAVVGAAVTSLILPKTYVAVADIFIDYRVNDPIGGRQFHPMQDESYLQTQFDVIKSVQVAERVIQALGLQTAPEAKRFVQRYGEQRGLRALAEAIVRNTDVAPHKNSRVIEIQYSSGDPKHAKDMANAIVKAYIDLSLEMMNAPARARRDQYNAQLESMSRQIDELQKKLTAYQQEHKIVDVDERADLESKQMNALSVRLIDIQLQRVEAQAKRQSLEKLVREGSPESDIPEIAGIGHISGLKAALISLDTQLANAKITLGARHPKYMAINDERQALMDKLKRESATAFDMLGAAEARLIQQEKVIESEIASYQKKTFENKIHRDVISSYQRQLDSVQKIYNAAIQKFDELLMTSNVAISNASVMQWAELPEKHAKPLLRNNLVFGLLAGLVFGFGLAFLLELMNRRVRCLEDLEREFDEPVMAKIGFDEKLIGNGQGGLHASN